MLRGSPHLEEISLKQVGEIAQRAQRVEYPEDAELLGLIGTASKLRGEGVFASR